MMTSGISAALAFIVNKVDWAWIPNSVDVIVLNRNATTLITLLVGHNYSTSMGLVSSCYQDMIASCCVMVWKGGRECVNVLEYTDRSTLGVFLKCPCTVLMVAITPSHVYHFYPFSTLNGLVLRGSVPISEVDITKYKSRGFDVANHGELNATCYVLWFIEWCKAGAVWWKPTGACQQMMLLVWRPSLISGA
jgi:hypothetical protein